MRELGRVDIVLGVPGRPDKGGVQHEAPPRQIMHGTVPKNAGGKFNTDDFGRKRTQKLPDSDARCGLIATKYLDEAEYRCLPTLPGSEVGATRARSFEPSREFRCPQCRPSSAR